MTKICRLFYFNFSSSSAVYLNNWDIVDKGHFALWLVKKLSKKKNHRYGSRPFRLAQINWSEKFKSNLFLVAFATLYGCVNKSTRNCNWSGRFAHSLHNLRISFGLQHRLVCISFCFICFFHVTKNATNCTSDNNAAVLSEPNDRVTTIAVTWNWTFYVWNSKMVKWAWHHKWCYETSLYGRNAYI